MSMETPLGVVLLPEGAWISHACNGGYHYLRWMMYEAVYEAGFPSPYNGSVLAPEKPGVRLGITAEYGRTE